MTAITEEMVGQLARTLWEELNIPQGRNWDDHAVSAARIYWTDRARVALTFSYPLIARAVKERLGALTVAAAIRAMPEDQP